MKSEALITDLIERTRKHLNGAQRLKQQSIENLNKKSNLESWSALECVEHLNLYGDFYLPEIEQRMQQSQTIGYETFKSGMLGNYFAKMMLPKEKLNKMKTFKDKNPLGSILAMETLDRFILQQQKMLTLLDKARAVNLTKVKTAISISSWIKLRLGDTLRVVIYHNERHLEQAFWALGKS